MRERRKTFYPINEHKQPILLGTLLTLYGIYLLQMFSPLRLNNDAITLISVAESVVQGNGFLSNGNHTVFPPGYPALLALLIYLGVAAPWCFIAINCIFIAVGLAATYSILHWNFKLSESAPLQICCLTLLSFIFVKHVTLPMTDSLFFGISMMALFFQLKAERQDKRMQYWANLLIAWTLALIAIATRRIGLALIPMLFWSFIMKKGVLRELFHDKGLQKNLIAGFAICLALLLTGIFVVHTLMLNEDFHAFRATVFIDHITQILKFRFTELGEMIMNLPNAKAPAFIKILLPIAGSFALLMIIFGIWKKKQRFGSIEIYFLCYLGILFVWPYGDSRFWLPMIPLCFGYLAVLLTHYGSASLIKFSLVVYIICFSVLGLAALAYSTRISFANSHFPELYGDTGLRSTYRLAFGVSTPNKPTDINPMAYDLLRRYERRASLPKI